MIGFVAWLLGRTPEPSAPEPDAAELDAQLAEATQQRAEAHSYRARAEQVGPDIRDGLKHDRFGAAMAAALEPRGWSPQ